MTAPRLTSSGRITSIGGGRVYVDSLPTPADDGFGFDVSADEERAYAPLLYVDGAVRITIEPVDAPAPGDALDYLAQARRIIADGSLDAHCDPSAQPVIARLLSLLNTASNAVLAERRAAR